MMFVRLFVITGVMLLFMQIWGVYLYKTTKVKTNSTTVEFEEEITVSKQTILPESYQSGIKGIQGVFVINLVARYDRRARMRTLLKSLGINPLFVKATDKLAIAENAPELFPGFLERQKSSPTPYIDPITLKSDGNDWLKSEIADRATSIKLDMRKNTQEAGALWEKEEDRTSYLGGSACWQSHLRVLKTICNLSQPSIVFEDDIDVEQDFVEKIEEMLEKLPSTTWGIIRLGDCGFDPIPTQLVLSPNVFKTTGLSCIHALVVHPFAACQLSEQLDTPTQRRPVDMWIEELIREPSTPFESLSVYPSISIQVSDGKSDIATSAGKPQLSLQHSASSRLISILRFRH